MTSPGTPPTRDEFLGWPAERIRPLTAGQTVVFAPGGTSRWYFLEYGDTRVGYGGVEQFTAYGRHAVRRTAEIAGMMAADGIDNVFVVGHMPGQDSRDPDYNRNLAWAYHVLVDEVAREVYDAHNLGVVFRGGWQQAFEHIGAADMIAACAALEADTADRNAWLIWLTDDEGPIPPSLAPMVAEHLQQTGEFPGRAALAEAYYGRPFAHVDIFLSNNKLSVKDMCPPLMTLGDLYFSVSPSYFMGQRQWRRILYDHLFARRRHYRDYTSLTAETVAELRAFYAEQQDVIMGVGTYHADSQTWRPDLTPPAGDSSGQ